ncbi:MAG TPA: hypothetical protein VFJ74_10375 [Gemmatimonadaceae bacterium]|nr:hypothetical protein [Gemmatimonadaceae bacterium]
MTRDDRGRPHDAHDDDDEPMARDAGADSSRPLDFSALRRGGRGGTTDTATPDDRWEALARRIDAAAAPELARRATAARRGGNGAGAAPEILFAIARSARPALLAVAASVVFALAVAGLSSGGATTGGAPAMTVADANVAEVSVARALSVDEPAASWIMQQRAPSADDLARIIDPEEEK